MNDIPFFGIVAKKQTYLNIVYILFALPFSTLYFSLLIIGLSLSIGLLIILIGFFIFMGTLVLARMFRFIEIQMSGVFLSIKIPFSETQSKPKSFGDSVNKLFSSGTTWKSILFFLFIKFPLDIIIFSVAISFIAITFDLLLAPVIIDYAWFHDEFIEWLLEDLEDPYILPFFGIVWVFLSLHVVNGLAWIYKVVNPVFLKD